MFAIVDEIVTRLLDHRCFTSGELKFFTQQFEETRNNYEPKQVDQIEKCIKDLSENDLPMAKDKLEKSNLFEIEPSIDDLLEQAKELIDMEHKEEKRRNRKLAEIIIKYEAEKSLVIKETQTKIADLDTIYADKANDLKKYYKELEAKWRLDKVQ